MTDFNLGDTFSISWVNESSTGSVPSFITRSGSTLTISPTVMTDVKVYTMVVEITDTKDTN